MSILRTPLAARLLGSIAVASAVLVAREAALAQGEVFRRADSNCDGSLDVSDSVTTLLWLFAEGVQPCCDDASDANDDGQVDIADAVFGLEFLFRLGATPPAPFPDCGSDPTDDPLSCPQYAECAPVDGPPQLTEWTVPWSNTRPRDPYVGPDGLVWFVGQLDDYVATLDPATGEFDRIDLPNGAGPHNLIVGEHVWYAGNTAANIGRVDRVSEDITLFPMPDAAARDPHTLIFDDDGNIWFTVQQGNFVGRLAPDGAIRLVRSPTSNSRPYGIDLDSSGRPWIALFGTNKIGTVGPESFEFDEFTLPRSGARPRRLVVSSDDAVWYVDFQQGFLGRLDPATGDIDEWPAPGGSGSRPYGMAIDDRDRLWFVETGSSPDRFVGFQPLTETFFANVAIPSGGGVRHMFFHEPEKAIWFGTDAGTIGRAIVE